MNLNTDTAGRRIDGLLMPALHSEGSARDPELTARISAHVLSLPAEMIGPIGIVFRDIELLLAIDRVAEPLDDAQRRDC